MRALANQARHRKTGHIHEGQELVNLSYFKDDEWECVDERCRVRLYPWACKLEMRYKVGPYFRLGNGSKHGPNCFVQGLEELAAKGRKRRISGNCGFPLPYPNLILLGPRRVAVDDPDGSNSQLDTIEKPYKNPETRSAPGSLHNCTRRSIRDACWFFVNFPHDRHLKLVVQGCEGIRYDDIFVRIGRESEAYIGPKRILYGEMRFKSEPVLNGDTLTITLLDKVVPPSGRERERRVNINMASWPQRLRDYLWWQVEEALNEARQAHEQDDRRLHPRLRPWLFFVGAQEDPMQDLFRVTSYPAIAILACRMPKVQQAARKARRPELPPSPGPEAAISYPALPSRNSSGLRETGTLEGADPPLRGNVRATEEVIATTVARFQATAAPDLAATRPAVTESPAAESSVQPLQLPRIKAVIRYGSRWFFSFFRGGG